MRVISIILLSGLPLIGHSQSIQFSGTITNADKKPIPSATVSIPTLKLFFPANENGEFKISGSGIRSTDTVFFSCIGYKTLKVPVEALKVNGNQIILNRQTNELAEVNVFSSASKFIKVGSKVKRHFCIAQLRPDSETAMFMQGSARTAGTLQSVSFFLRESNMFSKTSGKITSPFRLRIYAADSNLVPGEELIKDVIITSAGNKNDWHEIDISIYKVSNPEFGFFVCFSLLPENYYSLKATRSNKVGRSELWSVPYLTCSQNEFKDIPSYSRHSENSKWRKNSGNYLIRAVIKQ